MINQEKWIESLPKNKSTIDLELNKLDYTRWTNTISKKNNSISIKKYTLVSIFFICGLLLVSAVKNETRNLQKEINKLDASINAIKFNLQQALLDNEVITSPQNISILASEYLDSDLVNYKRSQILSLKDDQEIQKIAKATNTSKKNSNKTKNISQSVKLKVEEKIKKKKAELKKLEEMYKNPEELPKELKTQVANKIRKTKNEIKNMYNSPGDLLTLEKVGKWGAVQVVKVFLGMPVVPGR